MAGSNRRGRDSVPGAPKTPAKSTSAKTIVKQTIHSSFTASRDVQKQILAEVARQGFSSQSAFAIKLALEEALNNAIRHGNGMDHTKKIHVEAKITPTRIEIVVEDEGVGFNRGVVPDPTLAENLEKCSGRGILLIEAYMNEVHWTRGGRRLRMVKRNESDETRA